MHLKRLPIFVLSCCWVSLPGDFSNRNSNPVLTVAPTDGCVSPH